MEAKEDSGIGHSYDENPSTEYPEDSMAFVNDNYDEDDEDDEYDEGDRDTVPIDPQLENVAVQALSSPILQRKKRTRVSHAEEDILDNEEAQADEVQAKSFL
jgi:hypothetical protein